VPRHRLVIAAIAVCCALLPPATADARTYARCKSADLRYPFTPGGPKSFGVFRLKIAGGSCTTARRVAKDWMKEFEGDLRRGRVRLPRSVDGFTFTTLRAMEAQTYRERGVNGTKTLRFDYRVPNG
jgi:hypothetical protein